MKVIFSGCRSGLMNSPHTRRETLNMLPFVNDFFLSESILLVPKSVLLSHAAMIAADTLLLFTE